MSETTVRPPLPSPAVESLPDDPELLRQMIVELLTELRRREKNEELLRQKIDALIHRLYGRSSEKLDPDQLALFENAPPESPAPELEPEVESPPSPKRGNGGRRGLPKHLPRRRVVHELAEADRQCPGCHEPMSPIREETSEQLDYEPASVFVVEHVRPVYACTRKCDEAVVVAPKPPQPIDKGIPGPGLLAHVVVSKFADHLPLHRQEAILARLGVEVSRQTLCDWVAAAARLAEPVVAEMKRWLMQSAILATDDTPITVLEPGRPGQHTGRLWVWVGDRDHPCELYDFTRDRSRDGPESFLGDWSGDLQADAYGGYDGIFAKGRVKELGCFMHARRYFFEARATDPVRAVEMLARIRQLYRIEAECREFDPAKRLEYRQLHAQPVLDGIESWLEENFAAVAPKSKIGEAITYARNQWVALRRYATDGRFEIDNGRSERALRPVAVGRNNWLFAGSDEGGRRAALLYSLLRTAKIHGADPEAYLRDLFRRLPGQPADRLAELTPMAWARAQRQEAGDAARAAEPAVEPA